MTAHENLARSKKYFQNKEVRVPKHLCIFIIILSSFLLTVNSIGFGVGVSVARLRSHPSKILLLMRKPVRCEKPYGTTLKILAPGYIAGCTFGEILYKAP